MLTCRVVDRGARGVHGVLGSGARRRIHGHGGEARLGRRRAGFGVHRDGSWRSCRGVAGQGDFRACRRDWGGLRHPATGTRTVPKGGSGGHWGVIHSPVTNFPPASLQVPPPHHLTTSPPHNPSTLYFRTSPAPPSLYSTPPPTPPSLQSTLPPSRFHPAFQQPPFSLPPPLPTPTPHLQDSSAPSHTFSFYLAPQHPCTSPAPPRPLHPVPTGTCKPPSLQLPLCHPQALLNAPSKSHHPLPREHSCSPLSLLPNPHTPILPCIPPGSLLLASSQTPSFSTYRTLLHLPSL